VVGGAPCTQRWADQIGADAYAEDASDGVKKIDALLGAGGASWYMRRDARAGAAAASLGPLTSAACSY